MMRLVEPYMDAVAEIVFVANTPAYLFKHLRRALVYIANMVPLPALASELRKEVARYPGNVVHKEPYLYALFILMTYAPYKEVGRHLDWIRSTGILWIDDLTRYYEHNATSTSRLTVQDLPYSSSSEPQYSVSGLGGAQVQHIKSQ